LLKLAGSVKNRKNRIPLFYFSLKLKTTKIFVTEFLEFLMLYIYISFDTKVDLSLTPNRNQCRESESVNIFGKRVNSRWVGPGNSCKVRTFKPNKKITAAF
jgi:hypothetical protein